MTRRFRRLLALFFLMAGLSLVFWWLKAEPSPVAPSNTASEAEAAAKPENPLPEPMPTAPSAPLPAPGAPLGEIAATLQQRADAGDRDAACRLGIELLLCDQLEKDARSLKGQLEHEERQQVKAGDLEGADKVAHMQLRAVERQRQCAARPQPLKGAGWRYLRQAALAGQRDAVLIYAEGPLMFSDYSFARTPEFDAWRQEMPGLLQREFARGNPEMANALWNAHSNDLNLGSGLIPDDPVLAEAYRLLRDRLVGRDSSVDPRLDASQSQRSQALATRWHAEHFDNRRFPSDHWIAGTHMLPLRLIEMQTVRDLPICDRP